MNVELFNHFYFFYLFIAAGAFFLLRRVLIKLSKEKARKVLGGMLYFNFGLHFIKVLFPPYCKKLPYSLKYVTGENICAVSTIFDPFVFHGKKDGILKDYFWFISLVGGVCALLYPTNALGEFAFSFESIRFYLCHTILALVPLLTVSLGLWKPNPRSMFKIPLMFLCGEALIMLNEIFLIKTGFVHATVADFFSPDFRNPSMVFGPMKNLGWLNKFATVFVPEIFTKNIFGITGVGDFYWPVIWLTVPAFVYFCPLYLLLTFPFDENYIMRRNNKRIEREKEIRRN